MRSNLLLLLGVAIPIIILVGLFSHSSRRTVAVVLFETTS